MCVHVVINEEIRHIFEPMLQPEESLLWTDIPYPAIPASSVFTMLSMLIFVPLFGVLIWAVTQELATAFMSGDLLSIFVSVLLFSLFGLFPIFVLIQMTRSSFFGLFECYALSNKNILIRERCWPVKVIKIPLAHVEKVFQLNSVPARTLCILSKQGPSINFISGNGMPAFAFNYSGCKAYYLKCLDPIITAENLIKKAIRSAKLNAEEEPPHE